jgi:hypothetical protein
LAATGDGGGGGATARGAGGGAGLGATASGTFGRPSSSAMIRRMEARISSIDGSCTFAVWLIARFPTAARHTPNSDSFAAKQPRIAVDTLYTPEGCKFGRRKIKSIE